MTTPTADHKGFTDSTGRRIDYETGLREAAYCIERQAETDYIVELLREQSPKDVLIWLVYPESGVFADGIPVNR